MKTIAYYLKAIPFTLAHAALFYFWQEQGSEAAGRVLFFTLWVSTILAILICFASAKVLLKNDKPPVFGQHVYNWLTFIAITLSLVWCDAIVTAIVYLAGGIMLRAKMNIVRSQA